MHRVFGWYTCTGFVITMIIDHYNIMVLCKCSNCFENCRFSRILYTAAFGTIYTIYASRILYYYYYTNKRTTRTRERFIKSVAVAPSPPPKRTIAFAPAAVTVGRGGLRGPCGTQRSGVEMTGWAACRECARGARRADN